jgi:hypothetical protein
VLVLVVSKPLTFFQSDWMMMRPIVVGFRLPLPADENVAEADWGPEQRPLAISLVACVP